MGSKRRQRIILALGLALVALAAAITAATFEVTTEITHFLPEGTDLRQARISREVAQSELTRTVVLTVGGPDQETVIEASGSLAERLQKSAEVEWVRRGVDQDLLERFYDLYFERRLYFLSSDPEGELGQRLSDEGLSKAAVELKRQLTLPSGSFVRRIATKDPLLSFPNLIERLQSSRAGSIEVVGGQFISSKGRRGVIFVGGRRPAFHSASQVKLQADIRDAFDAVNARYDGALDLAQSGAGRFAIASERAIKSDITRISTLSTIGIVLLFLGLFRSPRALALLVLPLLSGIAGAAAVGFLVFGRLHGLTLAFGSTLIGVCIDYAVHLQSHHVASPHREGPEATMRHIWPALLLGALTTVAGLAGMAWTALPGIREIALFTSLGVIFALLATRYLLPPLLPPPNQRSGVLVRSLASRMGALLELMRRRRALLSALPAAAVIVCAVGLPSLRWTDDITALQTLDPELLREDRQVREQVSHMESSRFVVSIGSTLEDALRRNDEVYRCLQEAKEAGELDDFQSLHTFLWSEQLQGGNLRALRRDRGLRERFERAFTEGGFHASLFTPFFESIRNDDAQPLRWDDLAESPLIDMVRFFKISLSDDEVAVLTFLRGVEDSEALESRLDGLDDVVYFDQFAFLGEVYLHSRNRTLQIMGAGLVAVFLLILIRYRRFSLAAAAFAPALLAAATTLAIVGLTGVEANLLHLLGLLLVLSIGVDYGVFLVESRRDQKAMKATGVGLVIACLSTVLAFGLLALSDNPAMRAMGLTTGIGVLLSLVLAPTTLILLGGAPATRREDGGEG